MLAQFWSNTVQVVNALDEPDRIERPAVFLAGPIQRCADWQTELMTKVADWPGAVFNPRTTPSSVTASFFCWERRYFLAADLFVMWYPAYMYHPHGAFQLGFWLGSEKQAIIGCSPNYVYGTELRSLLAIYPNTATLTTSLDDIANEMRKFAVT